MEKIQMRGIFISYRRHDSDIAAGRLADDLSEIFGPDSVFRDVDSLEPGANYESALDHALNSCAVLLALIGPRWSLRTDNASVRRLDDPQDWVRAEISRALARRIRVVPVLFSGTSMPQDADLPDEMKPLLKRQAFEISDRHWKRDLEDLAESLSKIPGIAKKGPASASRSVESGKLRLIGSKQFFIHFPQMLVFIGNQEVTRM
jgi:hypothetical protein